MVTAMDEIEELVNGLRNQDHNYAYQCLKQLEEECGHSNTVYPILIFSQKCFMTQTHMSEQGASS
jgi:hypothetical protein